MVVQSSTRAIHVPKRTPMVSGVCMSKLVHFAGAGHGRLWGNDRIQQISVWISTNSIAQQNLNYSSLVLTVPFVWWFQKEPPVSEANNAHFATRTLKNMAGLWFDLSLWGLFGNRWLFREMSVDLVTKINPVENRMAFFEVQQRKAGRRLFRWRPEPRLHRLLLCEVHWACWAF